MTPTKVLFICHGNICRSPMAQYVMQHLVDERGLSESFSISSAATSFEEIGNTPHRGTRRILKEHGVACGEHRVRHVESEDYDQYDYLVIMDEENRRGLMRIIGSDEQGKVSKLLDWVGSGRDVADPWYTGNFEKTYDDVLAGCTAFLDALTEK